MNVLVICFAAHLQFASPPSTHQATDGQVTETSTTRAPLADKVPEAHSAPDQPPPSTWDLRQDRERTVPENEGVTMGMQALKTLFGLGIVLALLFLSSRLVSRKLGTVRWKSKEGRLQVADFMLLDGKNGIYIVEIDGSDWVVVTGPNGTSLSPKDATKKNFQLGSNTTANSSEVLDLNSGSLVESK